MSKASEESQYNPLFFSGGRRVGFHRRPPCNHYFLLSPTTKPSPATENSTTATAPRKPATACAKDRAIKWPTIEWISAIRCIVRGSYSIPGKPMGSEWHGTKASSSTGHWTLPHWSSSIKSWHKNTSFFVKVYSQWVRVKMPVLLG